jgi:hypothetical protein
MTATKENIMTQSYNNEGVSHPLVEAEFNTAFKVYKSDRRRAVIGDPKACIEALGLKRIPNVIFAHIGSGGDAYVGFKDSESPTGVIVRHFTIPAQSKRVRDMFDVKGSPATQVIMLNAPSNGRTLVHRRRLNKKRHEEIKAGTRQVKKRGSPKKTRIARIGREHRPKPKISKDEVSLS